MNIYLIGMPGSGKSTLGKQLAESLNYSFVDMDKEIEASERKTINEIFAEDGEEEFRDIEQDMLHEVSTGKNLVISTGGGVPCFFDNMKFINRSGTSIFLNVSDKELIHRILKNSNRPLFLNKTNDEIKNELKMKLESRISFYSQAQVTVTGDNIQLSDILEQLNS